MRPWPRIVVVVVDWSLDQRWFLVASDYIVFDHTRMLLFDFIVLYMHVRLFRFIISVTMFALIFTISIVSVVLLPR